MMQDGVQYDVTQGPGGLCRRAVRSSDIIRADSDGVVVLSRFIAGSVPTVIRDEHERTPRDRRTRHDRLGRFPDETVPG